MVTIADVAAQAGVGAGTVSRVLNNSPRVSAATRARVLAAIELLGYRPNPLAQGLSRGRCQTLGAVVPFFTHASAVERLRGVVAGLDGSRYDLVLFNVESPVHRDEHLASLTGRSRADGLLIVSLPPPAADLERLVAAGVPVVLLDARADGGPAVPTVVTDDVEGGRMATRHLLSLGHERIAFIGDDPANPFGFTSSACREQGFRESMADAGIDVPESHVRHAPHVREVARKVTTELFALPEPPTAVFAASDAQALGVLQAARATGVAVPGDLSVVGFDDVEVSSYAGLTTVRQPLYESGQLAVALLLASLDGDDPPPPKTHELALELVVRSTTAPPPAAPPRPRPGPARPARPAPRASGGSEPSVLGERRGRSSGRARGGRRARPQDGGTPGAREHLRAAGAASAPRVSAGPTAPADAAAIPDERAGGRLVRADFSRPRSGRDGRDRS